MARRSLLSADQRTRLVGIPTEASEMAKHYVLSPEDLALIRAKRRSSNRLGFAVQLCLLRHPGQGLDFGEHPPEAMIAFVARQLRVSPSAFSEYALRDQTRREHAIELQKALGLCGFRLVDWRACLNVGANAAWATDRGEPIVQAMLAHLRAERVLVPATAVLERIGLAARVRARKRAFQALAEGLTDTT
jgi:TnpA family transposase